MSNYSMTSWNTAIYKRLDLKKKTEGRYDIYLFLIPLSEFKNYLLLIMFYYYLTPNLINLPNNLLAK
jgi:hypothetical protein